MHDTPSADSSQLLSGWRYRAVIGTVLLAAAAYVGFALWSGWHDVVSAVGKVGFVGLGVALALSLVNYGLRFIRWQAYLHALEHPVPWWPSLKIYLAGFALTITPGKAGEALRGVLLKQWRIPYPQSLAASLGERLSDLLAVLALALFGLSVYPAAQPLIFAGAACVFCVLFVLSNYRWLQRVQSNVRGDGRVSALLRHMLQILLLARCCFAPRLLLWSTALSVIAWASEALAFYLILDWMGMNISLPFSMFIYAVSMLAGALSFMSSGLGGAEAAMIALLVWKGCGHAESVAATLVIRLATLWFAVGIGYGALAIHPSGLREPVEKLR